MADIRINALATTAASTASDDFVAVDGSANGTRKLNAFSPTFGGNLTVSGTGTSAINNLSITPTSGHVYLTGPSAAGKFITLQNGNATGGINFRDSAGNEVGSYYQVTDVWTFSKNTTISGNLTVSGGTITGGTSGMSLASGGTNQNLSITPSGTGRVHIAKSAGQDSYIELAGNGNTAGTSSVVIGQSGADLGVLYNRKNAALSFGTNGTEAARFFANGNLFIGASPVDGGQKLQVNGTAAITDQTILGSSAISANQLLSIKKDTANYGLIGLSNSNTAGYSSIELFDNTSTQTGAIGYGNASVGVTGVRGKVYMYSTGDIAFLSGGTTTALTLDSSQNATFAKSITASGPLTLSSSTQGNANFYAISTSASANFGALYEADARTQSANARWNWGTGSTDGGAAADSFRIRERVTGVNTLVISAVTGNATFAGSLTTSAPTGGAGAWELGVYSATAPTATGYVTIEIGGVQYKLLAST